MSVARKIISLVLVIPGFGFALLGLVLLVIYFYVNDQVLFVFPGLAESVTDNEMLKAKKELGREGVYAETSGAAAYAGAKKLELKGKTVLIVTGHGLKE